MFLPGTVGDRCMRRVLESDNPEPGDLVEVVDDVMREYTYGDSAEGPIKWRSQDDYALVVNLVKRGMRSLEPLLFEHVIPFPYHPEWRFTAYISIPYLDGSPTSIKLVGGADILVKPGSFTLWDLKMTENPDYWKKTLGQLTFYDIGIAAVLGEHPEFHGFLTPLIEEMPIKKVSVTDHERAVMMSRIIRMAHGLWNAEFDPKEDNAGCTTCEGYHACDKFKLNITEMRGRQVALFERR